MYIDTTFPPPGSGRLAQFMRMVDAFERGEIETAVDALIARLDAADGDADIEVNGDELDGSPAEDDWWPRDWSGGPGCEIADAGEHDGDEMDTNNAEDEMSAGVRDLFFSGPGCPIGDPGGTTLVGNERAPAIAMR